MDTTYIVDTVQVITENSQVSEIIGTIGTIIITIIFILAICTPVFERRQK